MSAGLQLLPAIVVFATALVVAVLALLRRRSGGTLLRGVGALGLAGSVVAAAFALRAMHGSATGVGIDQFAGGLLGDRFGVFAEIALAAAGFVVCLGGGAVWPRLHRRGGAFVALVLVMVGAGMLLSGEREMAMLIAGVVLLNLAGVGLLAVAKTDAVSVEAAFKHLLFGGVALGVLALGLAILYGISGGTDLAQLRGLPSTPLLVLGLALTIVALGYLVGAAPFLQGVQLAAVGTPATTAAAVIGVGGLAGATTLVRVTVSGFGPSVRPWLGLMTLLAAIACLHPAMAALREGHLRRLAGRLACLQGGLLLVAVLGAGSGADGRPADGVVALLFAAVVFTLAVLATFLAISMLDGEQVGDRVEHLAGLGRRNGLAALVLSLSLAALGGLPPLATFIARLLLTQSTIAGGYGWVAVVALAASVLGMIPVVRVIASMYVEDSGEHAFALDAVPMLTRTVAFVCALLGIAATVFAQQVLQVASGAVATLH